MRGWIHALDPGDAARIGRTQRAVARAGVASEIAATRAELSERLCAADEPVLLIAAGAWLVNPDALPAIPPSATGRPLIALGAVRQSAQWQRVLAHRGADLDTRRIFAPRLPAPHCAYLETPAAHRLGILLKSGGWPSAWRHLLAARGFRKVHLPALDVHHTTGLRVLQVITSLQLGGAERVTLDLAHELSRQGVAVAVAALGRPTREAFPEPPDFIDLSQVECEPAARGEAIANAARDFGADLVHAHLITADEAREIRARDLPLVMTLHNMPEGWPAGLGEKNIAADLILACAQAVERRAAFGVPVRTVWNGIGPAPRARTDLRAQFGWSAEDFVIVAIANPRRQKRLDRLPSILARVQERIAPRRARLLIAGAPARGSADAEEAATALAQAIADSSARVDIQWPGAIHKIGEVLATGNVLISVSAHEGLSLAHLEALTAGLPVLATDVGGTREIAAQCSAMTLLPPEAGDAAFAQALEKIARTPPAPAQPERCSRNRRRGFENAETQRRRGRRGGNAAHASNSEWNSAVAFFLRVSASLRFQKKAPVDFNGIVPAPTLPPGFTRREMAARTRWLYPRILSPRTTGEGLWLITNNFSTGGAQSSARRLLLGLAQRGVKVRAGVIEEHPAHPTLGRAALMRAGISVLAIPPLDAAEAAARLLAAIDADRPRAVLFWNLVPVFKVLLADALLDVPVFDVSPGEMYFASLDRYFANPRAGLPYLTPPEYGARLAGVVVKYAGESSLAARTLGAPVHLIRNGVALDETPRSPGCRGPFVIGTAARLSPAKRLGDLLDAIRLAAPRLPRFTLHIAGGPERGCESHARELRKQACGLPVKWCGEIADTRSFLAGLDLFAMISEPAGCPNASLEAMAGGVPVIATDVGGASEQIVNGVTGILTPPRDAHAFAEAIVQLAHDPARRETFARAGRERIRAEFSLERMVAAYAQLFGF